MSKGRDEEQLRQMANDVVGALNAIRDGTSLDPQKPRRLGATETNGWYATIGKLGARNPRLQIWFDHFNGDKERRFQACFDSESRDAILKLKRLVANKLPVVRTITTKDLKGKNVLTLRDHLKHGELFAPILEHYYEDDQYPEHYFGIYCSKPGASESVRQQFLHRAVAFFEEVARSMPRAQPVRQDRDVYPQFEPRTVRAHLRRERSCYLANACKERDGYRCGVCSRTFAETYGGSLGDGFAESHHLKFLKYAADKTKTRLEDLITVCANCHRMLHRMNGEPSDVNKLAKLFHEHNRP